MKLENVWHEYGNGECAVTSSLKIWMDEWMIYSGGPGGGTIVDRRRVDQWLCRIDFDSRVLKQLDVKLQWLTETLERLQDRCSFSRPRCCYFAGCNANPPMQKCICRRPSYTEDGRASLREVEQAYETVKQAYDEEVSRQFVSKLEAAREALVTNLRCVSCGKPCPSYRKTCKFCGLAKTSVPVT